MSRAFSSAFAACSASSFASAGSSLPYLRPDSCVYMSDRMPVTWPRMTSGTTMTERMPISESSRYRASVPATLRSEIVAHLGEELVAAREQLLPERVPLPLRHGLEDRVAKRFLRRIATGHEGLPDALVLDDVERAPIGQLWDRHAGDAGGDLAVVENTGERRELRQDVEAQTLLPATMGVADHHRDRAHPAIGPVDGVELRLGGARGGADLERSARTRQGLEIGDRIADEMLERYAQLVRCLADDVAGECRELAQPLHRSSVAVEESCVRSEDRGAFFHFIEEHREAPRLLAQATAIRLASPPRDDDLRRARALACLRRLLEKEALDDLVLVELAIGIVDRGRRRPSHRGRRAATPRSPARRRRSRRARLSGARRDGGSMRARRRASSSTRRPRIPSRTSASIATLKVKPGLGAHSVKQKARGALLRNSGAERLRHRDARMLSRKSLTVVLSERDH